MYALAEALLGTAGSVRATMGLAFCRLRPCADLDFGGCNMALWNHDGEGGDGAAAIVFGVNIRSAFRV